MEEKQRKTVFSRWVKQYEPIIYKVARTYTRSQDDKKDLIQEIVFQIWQSVPAFEGRSAESTWIYRVALNTAFNWKNKNKRHEDGREDIDDHFNISSEEVSNKEEIEWLYQEINKLNEIDKSICILLLEGYAYTEISNITGLSESNVGVRIHRIKKQLVAASKKIREYGI